MRRLLLVIAVTAGCSDHQPSPDASPTSVQIECQSHGTTFPSLEKACVVATDCFIAEHMVSCCGTMTAIGLNVSAQAAFTSAEGKCEAAYPGCGCAAGPTTAEDGRSEVQGTIAVRCDSGLCKTFVP